MNTLRTIVFLLTVLSGPAYAGGITVLTDIQPVRAIVAAVTGSSQKQSSLIAGNASAHDFALKPSDMARLRTADLFIWLGPGATPGLARAATDPEMSARALALNSVPGTISLPVRGAGVYSDAVTAGESDPHGWLHPDNAVVWAFAIAEKLAGIDPENAGTYQRNAERFADEITALRTQIEQDLAISSPLPFVQFHDAFQYFEVAFGLTALGAATSDDEEATSIGILADLRHVLGGTDESCVFVASDIQATRARALLEVSGTRFGLIEPTGGNLPGSDWSYADLLRAVGGRFADCLGR